MLFNTKNAALATLVLQNTLMVIFMHYSRVHKSAEDTALYASSTAVSTMEMVKFVACLSMIAYQSSTKESNTDLMKKQLPSKASFANAISGLATTLREEVYNQPIEILKLGVPSMLYVIQNNLLYFALSRLDAATFQVGYQVKILTTAVFSAIMLGKRLTVVQWFSLVMLTAGVSLAQLSSGDSGHKGENTTSGFVAVLAAACLSGFSGVYFERILKNSVTSLWVRNIQMVSQRNVSKLSKSTKR
jgi:UDP-sugar transporter A1/2/3